MKTIVLCQLSTHIASHVSRYSSALSCFHKADLSPHLNFILRMSTFTFNLVSTVGLIQVGLHSQYS